MRQKARKDSGQADIVRALRDIGIVVRVVNQEGQPDLLTYSQRIGLPILAGGPIQLSGVQEEVIREFAARDFYWTTQETTQFNLRVLARVIIKTIAPTPPTAGWLPIEVKQHGEPLTPLQQRLFDVAPFPIVHDVRGALAVFGVRG